MTCYSEGYFFEKKAFERDEHFSASTESIRRSIRGLSIIMIQALRNTAACSYEITGPIIKTNRFCSQRDLQYHEFLS